jgi:hypothetical protein
VSRERGLRRGSQVGRVEMSGSRAREGERGREREREGERGREREREGERGREREREGERGRERGLAARTRTYMHACTHARMHAGLPTGQALAPRRARTHACRYTHLDFCYGI